MAHLEQTGDIPLARKLVSIAPPEEPPTPTQCSRLKFRITRKGYDRSRAELLYIRCPVGGRYDAPSSTRHGANIFKILEYLITW